MNNILVTGGLGFIGSNLVDSLKADHNVTVVDNLTSARDDHLNLMQENSSVEYILSNFDHEDVLQRIKNKEFDYVFHLAAIPRVSYSVEFPMQTTDMNLLKTCILFEACKGNVKRIIFSSSSSVYGDADKLPTPRDYKKDPQSPYAWQKSSIEDFSKMYCNLHGMDIVCLRYFNVFGPGQYGNSAYATAVSAWCNAIKNGVPLRSDGTGEQSRDMCYIDNVVSANILAMQSDKKFKGECYNVACGNKVSNNEILEFLKEEFKEIEITHAPKRAGDIMHTQADISHTVEELGYEPLVLFWAGLDRTLTWWNL